MRYHDVSSPRWSEFRIRGYRRRPAAAADFDSRVSAPPALWIAFVEVSEADRKLEIPFTDSFTIFRDCVSGHVENVFMFMNVAVTFSKMK